MEFTADVTATFGAASETDGNLFGISEADWPNPMPMFLHVCDGAAAPYFSFSRNPARISSGAAAADMCQKADTDCDAQGDMFIMSSGLTLANKVNKPCVTVGSFEATYATAGNAWVVETPVPGRDGFGVFQEGVEFSMPAGQNGAAAGKFFVGANAPTFGSNIALYFIDRTGRVFLEASFGVDVAPDGSGAGSLTFALPFIPSHSDPFLALIRIFCWCHNHSWRNGWLF
jgi:hypothetical protein